jgi:hypothetical protein
MTRFYAKGKLGLDLDAIQWKKVDEIRARKKGKLVPNTIHAKGSNAWITSFSKLLKEILQEDNQ